MLLILMLTGAIDALNLENKTVSFEARSSHEDFGLSIYLWVIHWVTGRNEKTHNQSNKKTPKPTNNQPPSKSPHTPGSSSALRFNL